MKTKVVQTLSQKLRVRQMSFFLKKKNLNNKQNWTDNDLRVFWKNKNKMSYLGGGPYKKKTLALGKPFQVPHLGPKPDFRPT